MRNFVIIFIATFFLAPSVSKFDFNRPVKTMARKQKKSIRTPASVLHAKKINKPTKKSKDIRISFKSGVTGLPNYIKIPLGIIAIPVKKYKASMGKIVGKAANHVMVTADNSFKVYNVIYDNNKKSFFPLSSILSIGEVDANAREEISNLGFDEYHYRPQMNLLYVKTMEGETIESFQALREAGFKVELEVMRGFNKPF